MKALILPVITIGLVAMAPIARMTRAMMIEALSSDYIRTSRSMGLPRRVIVLHHAFKNAFIPVLTLAVDGPATDALRTKRRGS